MEQIKTFYEANPNSKKTTVVKHTIHGRKSFNLFKLFSKIISNYYNIHRIAETIGVYFKKLQVKVKRSTNTTTPPLLPTLLPPTKR